MRSVSSRFLRTVTSSHKMVARARVCSTFQTGVTPTGVFVPIFDGDVKLDGTADIRSTLDLTTDGTRAWPRRAADLLAPYGNEIFIERGIQYSDEEVEYVPLGYFRIDEPDQDLPPDGPIRISASDRMAGIIDARLLEPVQFSVGATLQFVFDTLIKQVYPAAVVTFDDGSGSNTLLRSQIADEDRFGFLDNIVKSLGKIWYWDQAGQLVIKTAPSSTAPVLDALSGAGGTLIKMRRKISRKSVYNAVVATGDATDTIAPVRGVAIDANPNSPTCFTGRFGPVPRFYSSSFLATDAQAQAAARAILSRVIGLPYNVDFSIVPNPALEPWDPVRLRARDDQSIETHVIESLTIPLTQAGDMTANTREQTVVLIGSA